MQISNSLDNLWGEFSTIFQGGISGVFVFKSIVFLLLLFYLFYAVLMARQIQLMNNFLETKLSPWTRTIGIIHMICVLLLMLVVLIF